MISLRWARRRSPGAAAPESKWDFLPRIPQEKSLGRAGDGEKPDFPLTFEGQRDHPGAAAIGIILDKSHNIRSLGQP